METLKIPVVARQDGSLMADHVGKVNLVAAARQSNIRRRLHVMPVTAQQAEKAGIDTIIVDVESHSPSLTRSSVDRARGLPVNLIAGSFMPIASAKMSSRRWSSRNSGGS